MGGKQSIEAGSSTNVRPSQVRREQSPSARYGHLETAYLSLSKRTHELGGHHALLPRELHGIDWRRSSKLGQDLHWLFYRSAGDQTQERPVLIEWPTLPCIGFAHSFMDIAIETGISPPVLCEVAGDATKFQLPMDIQCFVDACSISGPESNLSADESEKGLRCPRSFEAVQQ